MSGVLLIHPSLSSVKPSAGFQCKIRCLRSLVYLGYMHRLSSYDPWTSKKIRLPSSFHGTTALSTVAYYTKSAGWCFKPARPIQFHLWRLWLRWVTRDDETQQGQVDNNKHKNW